MGTTTDARFTFYTGSRTADLEPAITHFVHDTVSPEADVIANPDTGYIFASHMRYGSHDWPDTYREALESFCTTQGISAELALAWPDYREEDYDEYHFFGALADALYDSHQLQDLIRHCERLISQLKQEFPDLHQVYQANISELLADVKALKAANDSAASLPTDDGHVPPVEHGDQSP